MKGANSNLTGFFGWAFLDSSLKSVLKLNMNRIVYKG